MFNHGRDAKSMAMVSAIVDLVSNITSSDNRHSITPLQDAGSILSLNVDALAQCLSFLDGPMRKNASRVNSQFAYASAKRGAVCHMMFNNRVVARLCNRDCLDYDYLFGHIRPKSIRFDRWSQAIMLPRMSKRRKNQFARNLRKLLQSVVSIRGWIPEEYKSLFVECCAGRNMQCLAINSSSDGTSQLTLPVSVFKSAKMLTVTQPELCRELWTGSSCNAMDQDKRKVIQIALQNVSSAMTRLKMFSAKFRPLTPLELLVSIQSGHPMFFLWALPNLQDAHLVLPLCDKLCYNDWHYLQNLDVLNRCANQVWCNFVVWNQNDNVEQLYSAMFIDCIPSTVD